MDNDSSGGWVTWRAPVARQEALTVAAAFLGAFLGTLAAWAVVIPAGVRLGLRLFDVYASLV